MTNPWTAILKQITNGVYILTCFHEEKINGMIASWVCPVSYDPPLVLVAVHPNRYAHHLILQSGFFALHILSGNQAELIERFMGSDPAAKFASVQWHRGKTGCPILNQCVGYMECVVKLKETPGNHTVFVGEIETARLLSDDKPLNTLDLAGTYMGKD